MPDPLGSSAVRFRLPVPEPLANPLVHLKSVAFGYPAGSTAKKLLFEACSLRVDVGTRVVIVGANGTGKSTLLRLLVGEQRQGGLRPDDGAVVSGGALRVAYFHQHFVDQLARRLTNGRTCETISNMQSSMYF